MFKPINHNKKKLFGAVFIAVLAVIILGGSLLIYRQAAKNKRLKILEATWNQLSDAEKAELSGSWKDATIEEIIVRSGDGLFYIEEEYYNHSVYIITFRSQNHDLLGDIKKLVDKNTGKIIGYSLRD